jgi:hypothetical protein
MEVNNKITFVQKLYFYWLSIFVQQDTTNIVEMVEWFETNNSKIQELRDKAKLTTDTTIEIVRITDPNKEREEIAEQIINKTEKLLTDIKMAKNYKNN